MIRRCRPLTLSCLFVVAALTANVLSPSPSIADDDFDSIVADDYEAELCGWCTHDSCPIEPAELTEEAVEALLGEDWNGEDSIDEQLAYEALIEDELVEDELIEDASTDDESVTEASVTEASAAEASVTEASAAEEPVAEVSVVEEPIVEEPATEATADVEVVNEDFDFADEDFADEDFADEDLADEDFASEEITDELLSDDDFAGEDLNEDQSATIADTPSRSDTSKIEASLAAMATAACASAGISVEQIVEPFAMVGPQINKSWENVRAFQEWWEVISRQSARQAAVEPVAEATEPKNTEQTAVVKQVPIVDFDSEIETTEVAVPSVAGAPEAQGANEVEIAEAAGPNPSFHEPTLLDEANDVEIRDELVELASEEPLDVLDNFSGAFGPSILIDPVDDVAAAVETESSIVGSSPMIVSIDEAYLPYDLSVRDFQVDSLFSLSKRPFCIRARIELPEFDLKIAAEEPVEQQVDIQAAEFVQSGSADCLLDDWVWRATLALEPGGSVRTWLRPELAGQQLAALVARHRVAALEIAGRLAQWWPETHPEANTAGAQLLARADAIESGDQGNTAEGLADQQAEQYAQAAAAIKQWFTAIEGAASSLTSRWLPRLAQVSPDVDPSGSSRR